MSPPRLASAPGRALAVVEREALLVLVGALYAFTVLWLAPYELVQDSWLTLVSGREVADNGVPSHDRLTVMTRGARWIDQQWLAQLVFYGAASAGGTKLAVLVHLVLLTSGFGLALAAARRLGASTWLVPPFAFAFLFVAPWGWQLRAQSFAYPLFVALLWLLVAEARRPSRRIVLVVPLLVAWANLHGSAALGALLVVLAGVAFVLEQLRAPDRRPGWTLRSAALLLAPALLLVSPYGVSVVDYYQRMLVRPVVGRFVVEWQAPTFPQAWAFFLLAFATVWIVARYGHGMTLFEKLALAVTIAAGLTAARSVVWLGLAAIVVLPPALRRAGGPPDASSPPRLARWVGRAATAAAGAVAVAAAAVSPSWYEREWPRGPLDAVAAATARDPALRIFASARYADWLLWRAPELAGRVAYDVRFELYSEEQLDALTAFHAGSSRWRDAVAGYRLVVLDRARDGELEARLLAEAGARRVYRDERVAVVLRPGP